MIYTMTVFLTDKEISVVKIRDGEEKFMSFRGNTSMPVESVDDVDDFIEHCYDEYNINYFSELDFEVFVVNAGGTNEIYHDLIIKLNGCSSLGAADIAQLLPIAAGFRNLIKKNTAIIVSFLNKSYSIICDNNGMIHTDESSEKADVVFTPKDFLFLHELNLSLFNKFSEQELASIRSEYKRKEDDYKKEITELKTEYKRKEEEYKRTITKLEEEINKSGNKYTSTNNKSTNTVELQRPITTLKSGVKTRLYKYICTACGTWLTDDEARDNFCSFCNSYGTITPRLKIGDI